MVDWPESFPQLVPSDSYSETLMGGFITTQMISGPPRRRRRFTRTRRAMQMSAIMKQEQLDQFIDYYNLSLGGGTQTITLPYPTDPDNSAEWMITQDPTINPVGWEVYRVTLQLEETTYDPTAGIP